MKKRMMTGLLVLAMVMSVFSVTTVPTATVKAEESAPIDLYGLEVKVKSSTMGLAQLPIGSNPVIGYQDGNGFHELVAGTDYTLIETKKAESWTNWVACEFDNTVAGSWSFTIIATGKYTGSSTVYFDIVDPYDFEGGYILPELKKYTVVGTDPLVVGLYDGQMRFTAFTEGVEYEVIKITTTDPDEVVGEYNEPGSYRLWIRGKAPYKGETDIWFTVIGSAKDLSYLEVTVKETKILKGTRPVVGYWNGGTFVTLTEGTDYTLEDYEETAGLYVEVSGIGEYTGTTHIQFDVFDAADIGLCTMGLEQVNNHYVFVVRNSAGKVLTKGTDYTYAAFANGAPYDGDTFNEDGVVYRFEVEGLGDYTGSYQPPMYEQHDWEWVVNTPATATAAGERVKKCKNHDIYGAKAVIPQIGTVALSSTSMTYNGKSRKPSLTVTDVNGNAIDPAYYTASIASGTNAGTYKCTVTFKGEYAGSKSLSYTIKPAALKSLTLSATSYTWDGKAKTPTTKVIGAVNSTALVKNTDYTVTYASTRKSVGTYKVTVKGKGNYTGTISKTFTINPKGTSLVSLTAASKGFTVKWKKQATKMSSSAVTGYQVRYSTKSSMASAKTVTIKGASTVSKKITKLTGKKKYYVQVRTYKTVSGTKYYSAWSAKKAVTTKK